VALGWFRPLRALLFNTLVVEAQGFIEDLENTPALVVVVVLGTARL
jgi:hypothetical protein